MQPPCGDTEPPEENFVTIVTRPALGMAVDTSDAAVLMIEFMATDTGGVMRSPRARTAVGAAFLYRHGGFQCPSFRRISWRPASCGAAHYFGHYRAAEICCPLAYDTVGNRRFAFLSGFDEEYIAVNAVPMMHVGGLATDAWGRFRQHRFANAAESLVENHAASRMTEADSGDCEGDDISNQGSISRPARSASGGECPCRARSGHRVRPAPRRSF